METTVSSRSIMEINLPNNITCWKSGPHRAFSRYSGVAITLCSCSLAHTLILLLHLGIKMKRCCITEFNSVWFVHLKKSVLLLLLYGSSFTSSQIMLCVHDASKEFKTFSGTLHQQQLNVFQYSVRVPLTDSTLLIVDHTSSCLEHVLSSLLQTCRVLSCTWVSLRIYTEPVW